MHARAETHVYTETIRYMGQEKAFCLKLYVQAAFVGLQMLEQTD